LEVGVRTLGDFTEAFEETFNVKIDDKITFWDFIAKSGFGLSRKGIEEKNMNMLEKWKKWNNGK